MKVIPFSEALDFAKKQQVVLPDQYYGERIGQARAQARTISGLAGVDQIQNVFDQLDKVIKSGGTFRDFQRAVSTGDIQTGLPRHRLELVFRNNIQTAYMAGRWQQVAANKAFRPYLRYIAINDGRTRPSHRAMHNHIAPVDDPWWSTHHPQNGHNCRCGVQSLTQAQAKQHGIASKPPENAAPDKGWDYNAGQAPMEGLKEAAKRKAQTTSPQLTHAIAEAVKPTSIPVAAALEAIHYKKKVRHVLDAIGSVHGDGVLPIIPVKRTRGKSSYFMRRLDANNTPIEIGMSTKQLDIQEFALTHEIGHFLDFGALEGKAHDKITKATDASEGIQYLKKKLNGELTDSKRDYYQYLMKPTEIWARAYSQWIAIKSGNDLLLAQLQDIMGDGRNVMQWTDKDFLPIAKLIDALMQDKGWVNEL